MNGISDLCRMAIIDYVIIHNKSFELILTEDFLKKVTIRCEIVVDFALEGGQRQNHEKGRRFWSHFDQKRVKSHPR